MLDDGKENYKCLAKIFLTELKKRHLFSRYLSKSHEVEADDFISNELNSDLDYNYFSQYNPCWYSDAADFSNQVHSKGNAPYASHLQKEVPTVFHLIHFNRHDFLYI